MPVVDTKFELCRDAEFVLKIGRDYQNKDGFRGAHYDTVKLLCDTIEYLRDKLPQPDPDWKDICAKCKDGDIEPKHCKYYGEPNGCNSPIYGEHPTAENSSVVGDCAKLREALDESRRIASDLGGCRLNDYWKLNEIVRVCEAALAAPPRNCDVGTAEEQSQRFDSFCDAHKYVGDDGANWCSRTCPCYNDINCGVNWAQMPYESAHATERKGESEVGK